MNGNTFNPRSLLHFTSLHFTSLHFTVLHFTTFQSPFFTFLHFWTFRHHPSQTLHFSLIIAFLYVDCHQSDRFWYHLKFLFSSMLRKTNPALCHINFISEVCFLILCHIRTKTNGEGASEESACCIVLIF